MLLQHGSLVPAFNLGNCLLRLVAGQFVSIPLEALHLQADVQSYNTCSNRLILRAQGHPKRLVLTANILQQLPNRCSFRRKANDLSILCQQNLSTANLSTIFISPMAV